MDKDYCLSMIKSYEHKKLSPLDTRKSLEAIVQARKERGEKYWLQEECNKRKRFKLKVAAASVRNNTEQSRQSKTSIVTCKFSNITTHNIALYLGSDKMSKKNTTDISHLTGSK